MADQVNMYREVIPQQVNMLTEAQLMAQTSANAYRRKMIQTNMAREQEELTKLDISDAKIKSWLNQTPEVYVKSGDELVPIADVPVEDIPTE